MLPHQFEKRNCPMCQRFVARDPRKHSGRGMMRHRCPHGTWCDSGDRLRVTNLPRCKECLAEMKQREFTHIAEMHAKETI